MTWTESKIITLLVFVYLLYGLVAKTRQQNTSSRTDTESFTKAATTPLKPSLVRVIVTI